MAKVLVLTVFLGVLGVFCMNSTNAKLDMTGYKLVWSDEFDVDGPPNPDVWNFEEGFLRNHEHQWYQKENAFVKDGMLIFEARKEKKPNPTYKAGSRDWRTKREFIEYTSASITTKGKKSFKYGRFLIRAKIDIRSGMWPAIWTIGNEGEWPSNGEIDIMEYYTGKIMANAAWGTKRRWQAKWDAVKTPLSKLGGKKWADEFHVWRMDWDVNSIKLYVDDILLNETRLINTINADKTKGPENPFRQPHFILLNLALGGDNGGDPDKAEWPGRYLVDYVRVYQTDKQPPMEVVKKPKEIKASDYKPDASLVFDASKDAIGIHHYSEKGKYLNKKIGWGADADTEEFVWEKAAAIRADTSTKTDGKVSYKFTLHKDWARWVLNMKGKGSADFSPYNYLSFSLRSKSAASWKSFYFVLEDSSKNFVKLEMKDLGFKPDGEWHTVKIQIPALKKAGLDVSKMKSLAQIGWSGGIKRGHSFHIDSLQLSK